MCRGDSTQSYFAAHTCSLDQETQRSCVDSAEKEDQLCAEVGDTTSAQAHGGALKASDAATKHVQAAHAWLVAAMCQQGQPLPGHCGKVRCAGLQRCRVHLHICPEVARLCISNSDAGVLCAWQARTWQRSMPRER